jgi:predicted alpha/beta hydrolase family esterase
MTKILIVPGLHGSTEAHWQTLLERKFPEARRVEQSNWSDPCPAWHERLLAEIARFPDAIVVAHSLGCALVARAAASNPGISIKAALLVAPADTENAAELPELGAFAPLPRDALPFPSIVVASRNDPYMQFERARRLSVMWGSQFVDAGFAGHINIASGHGSWPAGEQLVLSLLKDEPARRSA